MRNRKTCDSCDSTVSTQGCVETHNPELLHYDLYYWVSEHKSKSSTTLVSVRVSVVVQRPVTAAPRPVLLFAAG